jgi:hypothetical protein
MARNAIEISVLDLAPITEGSDRRRSFRNSLDLAQHAERWGYHRFWLAEHHGMPGIASAATSVLIGHVAGGTSTIRVGAGGIMLPNHSPLVIAEQFGTLEALYPGRIDLGLGRAPGSDQATARALRRTCVRRRRVPAGRGGADGLLMSDEPRRRCARCPAPASRCRCGSWVPACSAPSWRRCWACRMRSRRTSRRRDDAGDRALPRHLQAVGPARQAVRDARLQRVRRRHRCRRRTCCATSMQQAFVNLRTGRPTKLPPPVPGYLEAC